MPFSFATPEDLVELEASLQDAWAIVVMRHGDDPLTSSAERERLAYVLATLWQQGIRQDLSAQAVAQYEATAATLKFPLVEPPEPSG